MNSPDRIGIGRRSFALRESDHRDNAANGPSRIAMAARAGTAGPLAALSVAVIDEGATVLR
jgi:hypothetical protein